MKGLLSRCQPTKPAPGNEAEAEPLHHRGCRGHSPSRPWPPPRSPITQHVRIHKNVFHLPPLITSSTLKMKYSVSYLDLLWVTTSNDINIWKKYENTKYMPSSLWFEQNRNLPWGRWCFLKRERVNYTSNRDSSRKLCRLWASVGSGGGGGGERTGREGGGIHRISQGQWVYTTTGDINYSWQKHSNCQRESCKVRPNP